MRYAKAIINKIQNSRLIKWILASKKRRIILLILATAIVFFRIRSIKNSGLEVEIVEVKRAELVESVIAQGEVKAEKSVDLVFLNAGEIKEIFVEDGQEVKKGDPIAEVDVNILYQAYEKAVSDLRDAQATLNRVYDDIKGHQDDESFAQKETRTAAEVAKDKAYRSFVIAQQNLANGKAVAPFDGIVSFGEKSAEGAYSSVTTPRFTIVDPSSVYFEAEVNEVDITKIKKGMKSIITLDAYQDNEFEEVVQIIGFISTTTSSGGTAYKVKVSLPENENLKFRLGMSGDIEFIVNRQKNILVVPATAITEEGSKSYVWKVNRGSKAKRIEVETAESSINDVKITSGISEGEQIIKRPPSKIEEGVRLKVKK